MRAAAVLLALLLAMGHYLALAQPAELTLVLAGDIMVHGPQLRAAQQPNGTYNFGAAFAPVSDLLRGADIAAANLELTLHRHPPYTGYPTFRSPATLAHDLRRAGFNLLFLANNHINDTGRDGIRQTVNELDRYHFFQTGAFQDDAERDAYAPLLIHRRGMTIAFVNYTYGLNAPHLHAPIVVNAWSRERMQQEVSRARALGADFVIAMLHWGEEYALLPSDYQRQCAADMAQAGVDLIVGAHPHVVQPIEELEVKDDATGQLRRVWVAYSLGNFVSAQLRAHTTGGLLLRVQLTRTLEGRTTLRSLRYLPVWRQRAAVGAGPRYRVVPIERVACPDYAMPPEEQRAATQFGKQLHRRLGLPAVMRWQLSADCAPAK